MSFGGGFGGGRDGGGSSETMSVESRKVGRIIGRGGTKIRELQDDSGARIQVSREEDGNGMKNVEISGTDEQVERAKGLIEDCLAADFGGGGGGGGRRMGGGGGGYGRDRRDDDRGGWGRDRDGGDSYGRRDNYGDRDGGRRGGGGGFGGGFGGDRGAGGESETIYVESTEVGRIIGRGGSRIREMEEDSGCRIKVSRDGDSRGMSSVELSGSKGQISDAKQRIQDAGVEIMNGGGSGGEDRGRGVSPDNSQSYNGSGGFSGGFSSGSGGFSGGFSNGSGDNPRSFNGSGGFSNHNTDTNGEDEGSSRPKIDWNKVRQTSEQYQAERFADLPPIIKNFYQEQEHIANMPSEEAKRIRRENNNIIVDSPEGGPSSVANPIRIFEDCFEPFPLILEQIYRQNFVKPSPIQCQAWPILLQGKDLIGIAQTGTGKTLAFLLPALIHIDNQPLPREERTGPSALILSPTRELAQQIEQEVNKISYKGIRSICVYGGGNRREQLQRVKQGVEIVVATPGRLNDFMMNGIIDVRNVTYLVMDEADRMLDMGFELEIKKVMLDIRPDRQTVMTSATWPPEVQKLADRYMSKPTKAFVGTLDLAAVHSVRQCVELVEEEEKKGLLLDFICSMEPTEKVIVFVGKKIVADDVSSDLAMEGIMCQCIHGDREQCDREQALREFKDSTVRILVATDVASRGLDVTDITHVINYDFPRHIEEYVHRIGRTGRAGRSGTALTFVTRGDWKSAQNLIDIMAEADQEIPDALVSMAERYSSWKRRRDEEGGRGGGRGGFRGGRGGGRGRDRNNFGSDNWI